ncbi:MAG: HAD family hydrolase [Planctomycetaceae bacterium]|nr:HAD family hydrolase [Planctomycetaceae bacterium]
MHEPPSDVIRRLSRPLEPIATGCPERLDKLPGIRAVLFDVYGTLFISGSGEVGTARQSARGDAFAAALAAVGLAPTASVEPALQYSFDLIEERHAAGRNRGIEYPEIDIFEIWDAVLQRLRRDGAIPQDSYDREDLKRLAVEYEARTNPVWPMPGLADCLKGMADAGLAMGIISNAQFFTRELFPALLGRSTDDCGFAPDLQVYSYEQGHSKPGEGIYRLAAERLAARQIEPSQALCVGNDMLNDIAPAHRVGFRTALFAGDSRSLRLRADDRRVGGIRPDLVVTRLLDLNGCILDLDA